MASKPDRSPSFSCLASIQAWSELPVHLAAPPGPNELLVDAQRRTSLEAVYAALHVPPHQLKGPDAHRLVDRRRSAESVPFSDLSSAPPRHGELQAQPAGALPPLASTGVSASGAAASDSRPPAAKASGTSVSASRRCSRMEEALGSQIATSAVPGSRSFNRVPSATQGGGGEVTWDEMGQLGLHKALNEYYKLSASQRNMRLCCRGGAPSLICKLVHTVFVPQLPAALSPPAMLAAAGWLLHALASLLYSTAALTVPLALWLAFAADGQLSLAPHAASAAARVHPAVGAAAERLAGAAVALPPVLAARVQHPAAALALLGVLLLALRLSESAVLRRRRQRLEAKQRRITAADVQVAYAGNSWVPPGDAAGIAPEHAAATATAAQQQQQQQRARQQQKEKQPQKQPSAALLAVLQGEAQQLWHNVVGGQLPASQLQSYQDIAAAVARLSQETGVEPRSMPAGGLAADGEIDPGRLLLDALLEIKHAVGMA